MTFDVILFKQPDNGYSARPVFWPDAVAHGATQQEALDSVRVVIRNLLDQIQVVKVEIEPTVEPSTNPWLKKAGMFTDDPTWNDFLEQMATYRQQLEQQEADAPA